MKTFIAPSDLDKLADDHSANQPLTEEEKRSNRTKSGVRAKVEHVFRVLKRQFGFTKVRYRGLEKNANHPFAAFALVNIVLAKRRLLRLSQA